jgi:hypothetical protein
VFIFVAIEIFPTRLPIWAAALALAIAMIAAIPLAMLQVSFKTFSACLVSDRCFRR